MQNVKLNKMFFLNIKIYLELGVWGLNIGFGLIGSKRCTNLEVENHISNFHKQGLILFRMK